MSPQHCRQQERSAESFLHERLPVSGSSIGVGDLAIQPNESTEPTERLGYSQKSTGQITRVTEEEKLMKTAKGIYGTLDDLEKLCLEKRRQQSQLGSETSNGQWRDLTRLHLTLLDLYYEFFLWPQVPSGASGIDCLPEKRQMPARLWQHGIHSLLDLLRHCLPASLEHLLTFIRLAYSRLTLLLERVCAFEDTWIECLGDLARYHMAISKAYLPDSDLWAGVARYWYSKAADRNPNVGRIQHHLAILPSDDIVQRLFYYTKSLVSVQSFPGTKSSIQPWFNTLIIDRGIYNGNSTIAAFVAAHSYLFNRTSTAQFLESAENFLASLETHIGRVGATFKMQGVYISSWNFAAILGYGLTDALLLAQFNRAEAHHGRDFSDVCMIAARTLTTPTSDLLSVGADMVNLRDGEGFPELQFHGCCLSFQTLSVILDQRGNKNAYPALHISLAFIYCLALRMTSIKKVEILVPWRRIVSFLNTMICPDTDTQLFQGCGFPSIQKRMLLPEDFLIRGQVWSQQYFPPHFFGDIDDEDQFIEMRPLNVLRIYRCLWLGVKIATFNRWITYDCASRTFSQTDFALELEGIAQQYNPFNKVASIQPSF